MPVHSPLSYQENKDDLRALAEGQFRYLNDDEPNFESTYNWPQVFQGTHFADHDTQVKWVWPDKIPFGKLTLIEGPPAIGKQFVALDIAARISNGTLHIPNRFNPAPATPEQIAAMEANYARHVSLANRPPTDSKSAASALPSSQPAVAPGDATGDLSRRAGTRQDAIPSKAAGPPSDFELANAEYGKLLKGDTSKLTRYVWPKRESLPPRKPNTAVIVICDYFDAKEVIYPRLTTLGADHERIFMFTEVQVTDRSTLKKYDRPVKLPLDKVMFNHLLRKHEGCRVVVIDNLEDYCDTPKQMNRAIKELNATAAYLGIAIIATVQTNVRVAKDGTLPDRAKPADGAARCIWSITADPTHPGLMRMEPKRMSFCKKPEGIAFRISDAGNVLWETLPEYQRPPTEAAKRRALEHARLLTWLTGMLASGVVLADTIYDTGREQGFSKNKLIAARLELGARTFKVGFGKTGSWLWTFKADDAVTPKEIAVARGSWDPGVEKDEGRRMKDEGGGAKNEERREKGAEGGVKSEERGENKTEKSVAQPVEKIGENFGVLSEMGWKGGETARKTETGSSGWKSS